MHTSHDTHVATRPSLRDNFKKILKKSSLGIAALSLVVGGVFIFNTVFAAVTITAASGGTNISIDTSSAWATPSWTTLTGLKIQENVVGDIATGVHTLTLPAGWEFKIQNVVISVGGATELVVGNLNVTPTATTLSFNVTAASTGGVADINFVSGIEVRPTGTTPSSGEITHSGTAIVGVVNNVDSFGTLSTVAGTVDQLAFTSVPTSEVYGDTFSVTVRSQDQFGNNSTVGLVANNDVTLSIKAPGTGTLATTLTGNIGSGSGTPGIVNFTGLTINEIWSKILTATADSQFTAVDSSSFNITARPITVTATAAQTKIYGAADPTYAYTTTSGSLAFSDSYTGALSRVVGETVALSPYAITQGTLDVSSPANYTITFVPANFSITAKNLTVSGVAVTPKQYDNTTAATLDFTGATLATIVVLDDVTINSGGASGSFADVDVANGKAVTVTGVALSGTDAGNYTVSQPTGVTGNITPRLITVTADAAQTKVYGAANPTYAYTLTSGTLASGNSFTGALSRVAGETVAGSPYAITQGTLDVNPNYTITFVPDNFAITQAPLTITAVDNTKEYNGAGADPALTVSYSGLQFGETTTAVPATATRAPGTTVAGSPYVITPSGAVDTNYSISYTNGSFSITQKNLTVSGVTVTPKQYDNTTGATLDFTGASLAIIVGADDVTINSGGAVGTYADVNVNTGIAVGVTGVALSGTTAPNYTVSQPTGVTGNITPRLITITASTNTKNYDGTLTSAATPTITSGSLAAGDSGVYSQVYTDKNVGSGNRTLVPSVVSILEGLTDKASNYTVTPANFTTGTINQRPLTVTAVADSKIYDDSTSSVGAPTVGALAPSDSIDVSPIQTFDTQHVGASKTLTPSGLTIDDGVTDMTANYSISYVPVSTGEITTKSINVTAQTDTKVADGTTSSAVSPVGDALEGNDTYTTEGTQTYDTASADTGKTLTATGALVNDGNGGNNYFITYVDDVTGIIVPAAISYLSLSADADVLDDSTRTITVNGYDQYNNLVTNNSSTQVVLNADNGGSLASSLLTLTAGVKTTTLTKSWAGVVNVNASSGILTPDEVTATFTVTAADTTAPVQSLVSVTPAQTTADVNFTSDSVGTAKVGYGLTASHGNITVYSAMAASANTITLTGLTCGTTYHYSIYTKDVSGNESVSASTTFATSACTVPDTTAPTVSSIVVTPTQTTASVAFTSDEVGTRKVGYGLTASHGNVTVYSAMTADANNTVVLTGLSCGTTYHYSVYGKDALGNESVSSDATFATSACTPGDATAPVQSLVTVAPTTQTTADINFTSDEAGTAKVGYGLTSLHGNMTSYVSMAAAANTITLTGLTCGTTYHYSIYTKDGSNNESVSTDATFATAACTPQGNGSLGVASITTVNSTMTADNDYANGGSWTFNITVPTTETSLALKFGDWVSGANSIATANNMRIYSAQASANADANNAITITAANTYSTNLTLTSDLDADTEGRQVQVTVDLKVPVSTAGGAYSTNYGVQSSI